MVGALLEEEQLACLRVVREFLTKKD